MSDKMKLVEELAAEYYDHSEAGGPDYNLGGEWTRRWTWEDPEGGYVSCTITAFVCGIVVDQDGNTVRDATYMENDDELPLWDSWDGEMEDRPKGLYVRLYEREQTEWLAHTDKDDLGGTETRSDYEYTDFGYLWPADLAKAESNCEAHVKSYEEANLYPEFF